MKVKAYLEITMVVNPENRPAALPELVRVFDWRNVKTGDIRLRMQP